MVSLDGVVVILVVHVLALDDDMLLVVIILLARLLGIFHLLGGRTRSFLLGNGVGVENTTTFGRRVIIVGSRSLSLSLFSLARCGSLGRASAAGLGRSGGVGVASILRVARVTLLERLLDLLAPLLGWACGVSSDAQGCGILCQGVFGTRSNVNTTARLRIASVKGTREELNHGAREKA